MRQNTYGLASPWLLTLMMAWACGGSSDEANASSEQDRAARAQAIGSVWEGYVAAMCRGFGNCCDSLSFPFAAEVCTANLQAQITVDDFCPEPLIFDSSAASECVSQKEEHLAACQVFTDEEPACARMCHGTSAPGRACESSMDCLPVNGASRLCFFDESANRGVCEALRRVKAGDACESSVNAIGAHISIGSPRSYPGDSTPNETLGCFDTDGLFCDAVSGVCKPFVPLGAACEWGKSHCAPNTQCDILTETCIAKASAGEACILDDECVENAYCISHVCKTRKHEGEFCTLDKECLSGCDTVRQVCMPDGGAGSPFTAETCASPA